MLIKRLVAACAILILFAIICAISAGWLLAHPVQTAIGNPPADLNAEPVTFASDSGATVHGWWCPIQNANGVVLLLPGIRLKTTPGDLRPIKQMRLVRFNGERYVLFSDVLESN